MNAHDDPAGLAPEPIPFKAEGPQPLIRETPDPAPYPIHALGPLRAAVEAVQGETQAPVAIPAASALSVASLALQGFADVQTLAGRSPLSLYVLTVAKSGERKSSCDAPLMAALRDHEREEAAGMAGATDTWKNAHALWKSEREAILSDVRKNKGEARQGAEADLSSLGREPTAPPSADRTVTEPTFEGLTRLYLNGQPSLGIFSDEAGQFLGGHGMSADNRQKTMAALNALWHGQPIRRTRAGEGSYTLYGRRLAAHLMCQPGVARAFLADPLASDSGFLSRFLICEPKSTIGTRFTKSSRPDRAGAMTAFSERLSEILRTPLPMDAETRELKPRTLPLGDDAHALLAGFADRLESEMAAGGDLEAVTAAASKAPEQAARIAGILTLWRDLEATEVGIEEMRQGIELAQFYLSEALRLTDAANISTEIDRAEKLRRWLLERWEHDEVMLRDVVRFAPIRALRESPNARAAIAMLERHGWLMPLDAGTVVRGSPRREAWQVVRP